MSGNERLDEDYATAMRMRQEALIEDAGALLSAPIETLLAEDLAYLASRDGHRKTCLTIYYEGPQVVKYTTGPYDSLPAQAWSLGPVSDMLGRENAIQIAKRIINAGGAVNSDGLAVRIVLAFDRAASDGRQAVEVATARLREALRDIRAELSHGPTANWEYIEKRFAEALDD